MDIWVFFSKKLIILLSIIRRYFTMGFITCLAFVYRMEFINVLVSFIDIMDLFAQACFLLTIVFQAFDGREINPGNSIYCLIKK